MLRSSLHGGVRLAAACRAGARSFAAAASPAAPAAAKDALIIFDTTLRDGEQSPGCTLQLGEKLAIAHQLSRLGVDVCEAGFPVASPGDFDAVRAIAKEVGHIIQPGRTQPMMIAGLARATEKDIDRCFEAVSAAPRHRVHTFLATSDIHLQHKLRISRAEALERAVRAVRHAKSMCVDVEFSTEDGGRSDWGYLVDVIGAVIEAGATTINVPDTVGYTLPTEIGALFSHLIAKTPGGRSVVWSAHCHNDLGLAVANSLAAVQAGARQVECTINGLGERAGNTALEEVVMTIATRPLSFPVSHRIDTTQLMRTSKMVSRLTGMVVQPNKAIVGANAFAHEAGIHQDGMLKNANTYEIMTPASVGVLRTSMVLGKHSGKAAFKQRLQELGLQVPAAALDALVAQFKALADEKKVITDADLESIVSGTLDAPPDPTWALVSCHVFTGTGATPTATATLRNLKTGGSPISASAMGSGPVDAVYQAIKAVVGVANDLVEFKVQSVTDGTTALGEVTIKVTAAADGSGGSRRVEGLRRINSHSAPNVEGAVEDEGSGASKATFSGVAADKDILLAAATAYVAAINRLMQGGGITGGGEGGGV